MSCMPTWAPQLDNCLKDVDGPPTFTFATVSKDGMPKARTCVFRSWLFDNKESGVMLFTTDARMKKVDDLEHNDGKFEACFYFPQARTQFRLGGFAQVLSRDSAPSLHSNISPPTPLKSPSQSPTSSVSGDESKFHPVFTPSYDPNKRYDTEFPPPTKEEWKAEWERLWECMSPLLKSSFRKPTPGSLLTDQSQRQLDAVNRGVDGTSEKSGKDNFLVVCMFVHRVDMFVDDKNTGGQRHFFTRTKHDDWVEQDVCP